MIPTPKSQLSEQDNKIDKKSANSARTTQAKKRISRVALTNLILKEVSRKTYNTGGSEYVKDEPIKYAESILTIEEQQADELLKDKKRKS